MRICVLDAASPTDFSPLLDGLVELAPQRVLAMRKAADGLAVAATAFLQRVGESYLDDVARYVLEGESGAPPERVGQWPLMSNVIALGAGDDALPFPRDDQAVELIADRLVIARGADGPLESPTNADLWVVPGGEHFELREVEERSVVVPGTVQSEGVTVLECSPTEVRIGAWTIDGGLKWRDDASVDWSHKSKMQVQG